MCCAILLPTREDLTFILFKYLLYNTNCRNFDQFIYGMILRYKATLISLQERFFYSAIVFVQLLSLNLSAALSKTWLFMWLATEITYQLRDLLESYIVYRKVRSKVLSMRRFTRSCPALVYCPTLLQISKKGQIVIFYTTFRCGKHTYHFGIGISTKVAFYSFYFVVATSVADNCRQLHFKLIGTFSPWNCVKVNNMPYGSGGTALSIDIAWSWWMTS